MKKIIFLSSVILAFGCLQLKAQDTNKSESIDPLDISKQMEQIEKYGVPTIATVDEMKTKADVLYESQSWKEAALAYEFYAKNVNWLANLLSQCVEPYYSASYDDRKKTSYSTLTPFIPFESKANECKKQRNIAYVKIGLCYKNTGDMKSAIAYLHKGLDLLSVDELSYWTMAKDAMAEILQFDVEKSK